jgi:type IV pilus assembly protein PilC
MPDFLYIAKDINGKSKKGIVQAPTVQEAHSILEGQGIYPISLKPTKRKIAIPKNINISFSKVKSEELIVFTEQFSTLISSGLSILDALDGLAEQTDNKYFKNIILNIKNDIESGSSIKTAFSKYKKVFPPIYLSLLDVGEQSGTLDKVLKGIAAYLERDDEIRKKISAAFAYPKFVVGVVTAVVIFLLVYILPKFVTIYNQAGQKLPKPTIIMLSLSKFLTHDYLWIIAFVVIIYVGYRTIYATKKGKYYIDKLSVGIPMFGKIRKFSSLSRFVHSLSLILKSGIDIITAIDTAANVTANSFYISELKIVQDEIKSGKSFSEALYSRRTFPRIMAQMAIVGEKSGRLDDLLDKLGGLWDRNIDHQIKNMAAKIEPTMIVVLGVIVGFIALAMYLPMFGLPGAYRKTL